MSKVYSQKTCRSNKRWSDEDIDYLKESWGKYGVDNIAKKVQKTKESVCAKAYRLKLGRQVDYQGYITLAHLSELLSMDKTTFYKYAKKYTLKYTEKKLPKSTIKITTTDNFFSWAKDHQDIIDVCSIPINHLGVEPDWLKDLRQYRIDNPNHPAKQKQREWTSIDLSKLEIYIKSGDCTLSDLANKLNRTESSVYNKVTNLGLAHCLKLEERKVWDDNETAVLLDCIKNLDEGRKVDWKNIAASLGRSENACRTKYRYLKKHHHKDNRKYWTKEEVDKLMFLASETLIESGDIKWETISETLNRSTHSCKAKYNREKEDLIIL